MYRVRELWSIGILEKSPWPRHGASVYGGRETSRSLSHKSAGQLSGSQLKSSDSRAGGRGGCGGSIDRIQSLLIWYACARV